MIFTVTVFWVKIKSSFSFWRSVGFFNHFLNSCTNFCVRVWAVSNQGELKWWEIGLTPAEWTIASVEQSFLIEEKDERLVKKQERGRQHKSKMLIPNPLIYLWLHKNWGQGKVIQRVYSWHLENCDRKGMKVKREVLFPSVPWCHPTSHKHKVGTCWMKPYWKTSEEGLISGCQQDRTFFLQKTGLWPCDYKVISSFSAGYRSGNKNETKLIISPLSFEAGAKAEN